MKNGSTNTANTKIKTEAELKRLYSAIKSIKGITSKITNIEYESYSMYETDSFKRLFTKAKAKATQIATSSNAIVGDVLSIKEDRGDIENPFASYKNLLKGMPFSSFGGDEAAEYKYVKSYIYKFSLK